MAHSMAMAFLNTIYNFMTNSTAASKYIPTSYTVWRNMTHSKEFSGNQGKHQNFDPSILPYKFGLIFMGMKQKKFFFLKEKIKMSDSKKLRFSKPPILNIFNNALSRRFGRYPFSLLLFAQSIHSSDIKFLVPNVIWLLYKLQIHYVKGDFFLLRLYVLYLKTYYLFSVYMSQLI